MRFLIDTHILIWFLEGDESLQTDKRSLIIDSETEVLVSIASLWEIAIKISQGKLKLAQSLSSIARRMKSEAFDILHIETSHLVKVTALPFHHKDPFDRMIIAQAMVENIPIVSIDDNFGAYGVELL